MKQKIMTVLAVLIILATGATAQTTNYNLDHASSSRGDLYATQVRYDPFPASPGSYVDVWFKVENRGDQLLENTVFTLIPENPISIDKDASQTIGDLSARQNAMVKFRIKISADALQQDAQLKYTWSAKGRTDSPIQSTTISIRTSGAVVLVKEVKAEPEQIAPGEKSTITIGLNNAGDAPVRYITARLGLSLTEAGETLPFVPVGSGSSASIINLAPGSTGEMQFNIIADPSAVSKPYKVPLIITYTDTEGKNISRTDYVGIIVGTEPDMMIYIDKTEVYDTSPSNVVLKFVNKGPTGIKFLTAQLQNNDQIEVLSTGVQYIGQIDSDDYQTGQWLIKLKKNTKEAQLPIVLSYQDANNKKYNSAQSITLPIRSKAELGIATSNSGTTVFILLILGAGGYYIWRRRKQKQHKA